MACKTTHSPPGGSQELVQIRARKAYWKSVDELEGAVPSKGEFPGGLPHPGSPDDGDASRRDFLSLMGFSLAAAGMSACRAPVQHAIPLPVGSDQIIPGVASSYATTCGGCASSCSLLVKQRDGRPIKVDGNDESPLFGGGTCAVGQATVLSLYDDERLRGPTLGGQKSSWRDIDRRVIESLERSKADGKQIVLLSGTITSPSTREILAEWQERFPTFRHVVRDAVSFGAMRAANQQAFGLEAVPHYAFDKARVIVALEADFLGTWLSPVEFSRQYAAFRKPEPNREAPLHVQIESGLSLTGSNADVRIPVAPSELGAVAVALLSRIARRSKAGGAPDAGDVGDARKLDKIADALWRERGRSLVVTGSQDVNVQLVVAALNALLGNVGATLDLTRPSLQRQGDDAGIGELVEEMEGGAVGTLIVYGVNPLYDYRDAARFGRALAQVGLSVSLGDRVDETSSKVHAICPDHHFLEAWGDAEPVASSFSLAQPLIAPLHDTRAAQESLLVWVGAPGDYYARLRAYWRSAIFPQQHEVDDFDLFWDRTLQRGVLALAPAAAAPRPAFRADYKAAAARILGERSGAGAPRRGDELELHAYESVALHDGRHVNNPWLLELPDPITKVTWGNYAAIAPALARKLGVQQGDVLALGTERGHVELPAVVQPGQHERTVSVAVGYGRQQVGKAGNGVGANVFALGPSSSSVTVVRTGRRETLASTQSQFTIDDDRPIILETSLRELRGEKGPGHDGEAGEGGEAGEELPNLWAKRPEGDHAWGMAIDINACTGCSACVVSCQAENNVPVVGKVQVRKNRIMHWLRIDHYYSGPAENPASVYQPMMCQHCGHAPCETVCPVLATTTSSEGINQQVYNRCIGTRYCANNCPYKVRRFNWHNYTENDDFDFNMRSPLGRMVLNPDVTVRSRGVMEKCSLCVQRIQLAKNTVLKEKRELHDGDIQTACQQACPTQAIVFGDLKDPESRVSRLMSGPRAYHVLEELGTRPNVGYLKKVRNGRGDT